MRFFHIASNKNAEAIFKDGFRDGTGYYLTDRLWKGVLSANRKIKGPWVIPRSFLCLKLAGAGGFEPPATGFGDQRSGQTELRSCVVWRLLDAAPAAYFTGRVF